MGRGDELLERWIIGDRFVHHDALRRFIEQVRHSPDPQALVPELRRIALDVMRVKSFQLILLDETTRNTRCFSAHPERLLGPVADLHADSPVFRYFQLRNPVTSPAKSPMRCRAKANSSAAARLQLRIFDPEFCFRFLRTRAVRNVAPRRTRQWRTLHATRPQTSDRAREEPEPVASTRSVSRIRC
jgi:hypothetical protein